MVPFEYVMGKEVLGKKMSSLFCNKICHTHLSFMDSPEFGHEDIEGVVCSSIYD